MARISLFQSVALAVLAAVGTMAVPAQAQDVDREEMRAVAREARQQARAERQAAAPQQQQAAAPQQQAQAQAQAQTTAGGRNWNRGGGGGGNGWEGRAEARQQQRTTPSDGDRQARAQARQEQRAAAAPQQRSAPEGGWRSQRAPEGQRYDRNWDNNGAVSRPDPALAGATPQVPERGTAEARQRTETRNSGEWATRRNRTYSDPNRNDGYVDQTHNGTAHDWRNQQGDRNGTYGNGYRDGRGAQSYRDWHDQNHDRNRYADGTRKHHRWDHNNWRRDTRYNWSGYRSQHRDLYRAGRYYSPYNNYRYSRLSIGFFLDSGFYGNRYWIDDPWQYRLPQVYGPYRWVRYYDDVLLVDIYSGEVVDVIHDFFW